MNITEFAIGNYVLLNGQPERIRGIQEDQFEEGRHVLLLGQGKVPLWYTLKEIESIPATKDFIMNIMEENSDCLNAIIHVASFDITTYDLHDFCNLYKIITGDELQIDYDKLKAAI